MPRKVFQFWKDFFFPVRNEHNRRRQRKASEQYRAIQNPPPQGCTTLRNYTWKEYPALYLLLKQCLSFNSVYPKCKSSGFTQGKKVSTHKTTEMVQHRSLHWWQIERLPAKPAQSPASPSTTQAQDHLLLAQVMGKDPSQMPSMSCIFSSEWFCQCTSILSQTYAIAVSPWRLNLQKMLKQRWWNKGFPCLLCKIKKKKVPAD